MVLTRSQCKKASARSRYEKAEASTRLQCETATASSILRSGNPHVLSELKSYSNKNSSKGSECQNPQVETQEAEPPRLPAFQTLISVLEHPQGFKSPVLRSLYLVLTHLSSNIKYFSGKGMEKNELVVEIGKDKVSIPIKDLCRVSEILFRELQRRLKKLHGAIHDVSASMSLRLPLSLSERLAATKELNLLLRCSMVTLALPLPQVVFLENGKVLLGILRKLSLINLPQPFDISVSDVKHLSDRPRIFSGKCCSSSPTEETVPFLSLLEISNPCNPILLAVLEVFIDELLVHEELRKSFWMIDSLSPITERLFKHDADPDDIGIVMEVVYTYFFLSFNNEREIQDFLNGLTWVQGKNLKAPELSATAAISLLLNPHLLSSPKLVQAYMISLVCDAISFGLGYERLTPDIRLIDSYLSAFKRSVILYTQLMSTLQTDSDFLGAGAIIKSSVSGKNFPPTFSSRVEPGKRKKLNHLMDKLNDSWHSHLRSTFSKSKSELVTTSIAYINESRCMLDIKCRDEVLSFLISMLPRAANDGNCIVLPLNGNTSFEDICLLSSLLKLMSNSLIQALWCLRHINSLSHLESLKSLSPCKEYDFIVETIFCFKEFSLRLQVQKLLYNTMETHSSSHKQSRWMLLHFIGLLSLSYASGLDFLVKGCLSVIMALTNVFLFEEDNIDALISAVGPTSGTPLANLQKALVIQKSSPSSLTIASKFQKIQALYRSMDTVMRDPTRADNGAAGNLSISLVSDLKQGIGKQLGTSNGKLFLQCVHPGSPNLSDFDELCDFIECKKGKDYSGWLRNREKYRKHRFATRAKIRLEKRRKIWKFMKWEKA